MFKRVALIATSLAILWGAACAESVLCINAPGVVALTDTAGIERIENGRFEEIFTVREGALYAAGKRGEYRLFDARGQAVGDTVFSMINDEGDALVFRSGGFYGAMSAGGEVLLPAQWTQLTADGMGGWLALESDPVDEQPDELIHIDAEGGERRCGILTASGLSAVSGGRMPFMDSDGLWGAVNGEGDMAIEPAWRYMSAFDMGVAKVAGPKGMGLIDAEGRTVVAPQYAWLERSASMTAAWNGEGVDVYPPRGGQRRFSLPGSVREVALVGSDLLVIFMEKACLYDASGTMLVQSGTGTTYAPGTRGRLIASDGEWGEKCQRLVNPDGSTASARFQQLLPLCSDRYAFLEMDGIEYYSAELGRLQKTWDYSGQRYGLTDGAGRILLPARFRELRALSENRLLLIGDGEVQLTDRNGVPIRTWITAETEAPTGEAGE